MSPLAKIAAMHAETPDASSPPSDPTAAATPVAGPARRFGDFVFDPAAGQLLRAGQPVPMQPRYFAVLGLLLQRAGCLVSKDELLDAVWGHRYVSESALRVAIHAVREALDDESRPQRWLQTVPRRGYRLDLPADGAGAVAAAPLPFAGAPRPAVVAMPGNLPRSPQALIGREAEMQAIASRLVDGALLTLHGPGGVGKTRLALAAAAVAPPAHGVWLLRLDGLQDASPLLPTLGELLGLPADAASSPQALARALAPLRLRLVLDNAEHLVDAVATLAEAILAAAPGMQLLVTSQRPLQIAGEQLLPILPLALPPGDASAAEAVQAASLQLLLARIEQAQPGFAPDAEGLGRAAAICRALDGLPLALELAAARVPTLGLAGVQARLDERLGLLTRGSRDAPQRHRTLRAALEWSVSLLTPEVRAVLAGLSVFPGSFTASAAQAVLADAGDDAAADAVLDALETLREHALLQVQTESLGAMEPQLRLLDSVRALADELLSTQGRHDEVADAHLRWVAARFTEVDEDYVLSPILPWLARTRPLAEDLRQAIGRALQVPALRQVALALFRDSLRFRLRAGARREALAQFETLRAWLAEPEQASDEDRACMDAILTVMGGSGRIMPLDEAVVASMRCAQRHLEQGDLPRAYIAMGDCLAMLLRQQAPLEGRQALCRRMRALEQPDWPAALRRHGIWQEATLLRAAGDLEGYLQRARDMIASSRANGDLFMAWVATQAVAQMYVVRGELDAAHELMSRTIDEMRAGGSLRAESVALALAATIAVVRADDAAAHALLRETIPQLQADEMLWWMADALAWLPLHQQRWRDAARVQGWADSLVRARGDARGVMFGRLRERMQQALDARPDAAALLALLAQEPPCSEAEAVALTLAETGRGV